MNIGPNHRIKAYVKENAVPLKASEAISGSPFPWKVFARTPRHAVESEIRVHASVLLRVWDIPP